jgi:hypothetical protein
VTTDNIDILTEQWLGDIADLLSSRAKYERKIPAANDLLDKARKTYGLDIAHRVSDSSMLNGIIADETRKNRSWYRRKKVFSSRPEVKVSIDHLLVNAENTRNIIYQRADMPTTMTDYALQVKNFYMQTDLDWRDRRDKMAGALYLLETALSDGTISRRDSLELDLLLKVLGSGPKYAREQKEHLVEVLAKVLGNREARKYDSRMEIWMLDQSGPQPIMPTYESVRDQIAGGGLLNFMNYGLT